MKYILNKIPIKTTNSFNLNELQIDLDIPNNSNYKDFEMINSKYYDIKTSIKKDLVSNIGLSFI